MDINDAVAQLRAAFPRVTWLRVSSWGIEGRANGRLVATVKKSEKVWVCADYASGEVVDTDPISSVRAWLAAQPTAAFYPEATSGETVEVRGFVVVNAAGEYHARGASWGTYESEWGARNAEETFGVNCEDALSRRSDAIPFIVRVPLPVEPPVLVGEVSDV